jgi:GntR family transcriptional regulator
MADSDLVVRSKSVSDQAADIIRERIIQGVYGPERRMPSEAQLASELHISRSSLRTALASLAAEGYIRRHHGDGTYACPRNFHLTLRPGKQWDIERQILQSGRQPSLRILEMRLRPARSGEAKHLAIQKGESLLVIRRLVLADQMPIGSITSLIAGQGLAAGIPVSEGSLPPQEFLQLYHKSKPREGTIRFFAALADAAVAKLLGIEVGDAILCMEGIYYDGSRTPLLYTHEVYRRGQGFEFQTEFPLSG